MPSLRSKRRRSRKTCSTLAPISAADSKSALWIALLLIPSFTATQNVVKQPMLSSVSFVVKGEPFAFWWKFYWAFYWRKTNSLYNSFFLTKKTLKAFWPNWTFNQNYSEEFVFRNDVLMFLKKNYSKHI